MKFALHSHGYTVDNAIPRTALDKEAVAYTENKKVGWIPKQSFDIMRQKFGEIFPKLAESESRAVFEVLVRPLLTLPRADGVHPHVLVL